MSKGIKMSDCRFYIDEDARVVVCVIPNTEDMVVDYIYDHFCWSDFNMLRAIDWHLMKKLEMPNSFIGKAVCAPEDEFDIETGKMLAFSRAKNKCYKSFFKRANTFVQALDMRLSQMVADFNEFGEKLSEKQNTLAELVEDRVNK